MQNSFCISMYPYPSSTFCYPSQPYGPPTYVPCVFCHSTIPSASMAAHLAQCPNALAAAPPTATSTPFGSTQSVQYRRVVRVERKTVNERDIQPIPIAPNPPVYVQETRRTSAPWNQGIPEWAIEDGSTQSVSSQSSHYQKPLPPVPQQSQANRGVGMQRGAAVSPQAANSFRSQQQSAPMQTMREQGTKRMPQTQQTQAVPMQRPQVIQSSAQQVIQRNTQIPGQVSAQPRPTNPRPMNHPNGNQRPMNQSSGNQRPVNQQPAQQRYPNQQPMNPKPMQQNANQPPVNPRPMNQQPMNASPAQQSQRSARPTSQYAQSQPPTQPVGEVETLNPGSFSDRIKMFESKATKQPSPPPSQAKQQPIPRPQPQSQPQNQPVQRPQPQSQPQSQPISRPQPQNQSISRPQPAPRPQPQPQPQSRPIPRPQPAPRPQPQIPAPQRASTPSQPPSTSFASQPPHASASNSTPTPRPSMKERTAFLERAFGNASAAPPKPAKPALPATVSTTTAVAVASSSGLDHFEKKSEGTAHPNRLKMPETAPGQLSLAEMLQKRQMNGAPPPVVSKAPAPAPAPSPSPNQSTAVTRYEKQEKRAEPKPLAIPATIPGQKSLQEIMAQRTEVRFTDEGKGEYFHQQTQTVQQTVQTSIPPSNHPAPIPSAAPTIPPQSEDCPSSPVITFEDKEMQEMQEQERRQSAQSQTNTQPNEETVTTNAGSPLYTASGVFVVELSKEDMKLVFAGDSTLPFNGYSNSVMCIYPDQICFYYYNEASSSYQFIVLSLNLVLISRRIWHAFPV